MEEKINIAEILKDKPKGIRLYSPIFGECAFSFVREETDEICVKQHNGKKAFFNSKGLYNILGECLLFPSKEMRDWRKFAWKKGDVLVDTKFDNINCIFDAYISEDYTRFRARYCYRLSPCSNDIWFSNPTQIFSTKEFMKGPCPSLFIKKIEEHYNGKLNLETLEVEKQHEFKDGDILLYKSAKLTYASSIFILDTNRKYEMRSYVRFSLGRRYIDYDVPVYNLNTDRFRYATEEEKQQLFSALAKEGKAWDADKKIIVDLKPKVEFKPFDKVLVRDSQSDKWRVNLFGYIDKDEYYHCAFANWVYCIPYAGNEHLLGTTKDVEG